MAHGNSKYSDEIATKICEQLSTSSKGLAKICEGLGVSTVSVFRWIEDNEDFRNRYARAREAQADFLADEIIQIADDGSRDTKTIFDKAGNPIEVEDTEWTKRSQLRVDARKWTASKLKPKKYGDKIQTEHSGAIDIKQVTGMKVD